ncbi:unnamed protein product [Linum trigynum]|uniref:Chromo domain-containing protein n=1 Tax=Linum trigynum TaxID=586398 RepID=A0AAV2FWG4_9ROSI
MADRHKTEREFQVEDQVYLKLRPYRKMSVQQRANQMLSPKYYGPFLVLKKIGVVAYRLQLPVTSTIHPVFHVSLLKQAKGAPVVTQPALPDYDNSGELKVEPLKIVARRLVAKNNRAATQLLVQWTHQAKENSTWEYLEEIQAKFPHFKT